LTIILNTCENLIHNTYLIAYNGTLTIIYLLIGCAPQWPFQYEYDGISAYYKDLETDSIMHVPFIGKNYTGTEMVLSEFYVYNYTTAMDISAITIYLERYSFKNGGHLYRYFIADKSDMILTPSDDLHQIVWSISGTSACWETFNKPSVITAGQTNTSYTSMHHKIDVVEDYGNWMRPREHHERSLNVYKVTGTTTSPRRVEYSVFANANSPIVTVFWWMFVGCFVMAILIVLRVVISELKRKYKARVSYEPMVVYTSS